jgi:hypothetical protein
MEEKILALAELLGIDESEITQSEYNDDEYEISDGREYLVLTDDEADDAFYNSEMSLIDDLGITAFTPSFQKRILTEFGDEDWFYTMFRDFYGNYAYDISGEEDDVYGTRLVRECYEAGLIDDDNFRIDENGNIDYTDCLVYTDVLIDQLGSYLTGTIDNYVEEFKFEFGEEELSEVVNRNNLVDWDAVIEEIKELDGRGLTLASYDGEELEWGDYYIYRTN